MISWLVLYMKSSETMISILAWFRKRWQHCMHSDYLSYFPLPAIWNVGFFSTLYLQPWWLTSQGHQPCLDNCQVWSVISVLLVCALVVNGLPISGWLECWHALVVFAALFGLGVLCPQVLSFHIYDSFSVHCSCLDNTCLKAARIKMRFSYFCRRSKIGMLPNRPRIKPKRLRYLPPATSMLMPPKSPSQRRSSQRRSWNASGRRNSPTRRPLKAKVPLRARLPCKPRHPSQWTPPRRLMPKWPKGRKSPLCLPPGQLPPPPPLLDPWPTPLSPCPKGRQLSAASVSQSSTSRLENPIRRAMKTSICRKSRMSSRKWTEAGWRKRRWPPFARSVLQASGICGLFILNWLNYLGLTALFSLRWWWLNSSLRYFSSVMWFFAGMWLCAVS